MSREFLTRRSSTWSSLTQFVTYNWPLKSLSLIIALVLYTLFHHGREAQRTVEVDVFWTPPADSNQILLTTLPQKVFVTLQGPRALLDELPSLIEPMHVDLSNKPTNARFSEVPFSLPTGVHKLRVQPPSIPLRWDTKITREVRVDVVWSAPSESLMLRASPIVKPHMVSVTGPKSLVESLQRLRTESLNLAYQPIGAQTQILSLDLGNEQNMSTLQLEPERVQVQFEIIQETKTKTFPNIPVLALKAQGIKLRPAMVSIVATCPPLRFETLQANTIVPTINLEQLGADFAKKGPEEAEVKLELAGCTEVVISPPKVIVSR